MSGYFDSAASMPICPRALLNTLTKINHGNPSSAHLPGNLAKKV